MATQEKMMGNWNQFKGQVKKHWGQLTDDELQEVEGNIDQLIGLIQQKSGDARKQIERTLYELSEEAGGIFTQATEAARQYAGQATDAARQYAGQAGEAFDQVRERAMHGYEETQEMIRRRPAESIAVAFGTGLLLGVIVGLVAGSRD